MDIGTLTGQIALEDQMSSALTILTDKVKNFADGFEGAFGSALVAVGAATVAIAGVSAAITALGVRGAAVQDVADTLDHFAGSSENAAEIMTKLRSGTRDTIDDFELLKTSSRLLSAGVKLTADDFGSLGQAAFVLQDRGLGTTKEMLDLVSDAMVTGRTRALAMKLGVIDAGDAEETFAKSLGFTKAELSDTGKAEAHRIAVMGMLNSASKDASAIQRDFGDVIEQVKTKIANWTDELSRQVASSPAVMQAMDAIGAALVQAFGGSSEAAIQNIVAGINHFADAVTATAPYIVTFKDAVVATFNFISDHIDLIGALTGAFVLYKAAIIAATTYTSLMTAAQALLVLGCEGAEAAIVAFTAATGPLVVAVAAVTAVLYAGKIQWDTWATASQTATDAAKTAAAQQQVVVDVNKKYGTAFTTFAEATRYSTQQVVSGSAALMGFIGPTQTAAEAALNLGKNVAASGKSFLDLSAKAKEAAKRLEEALANNIKVDQEQRAKSWAWQAAMMDFNGQRAIDALEQQYKDQQAALANNIKVDEAMRTADWARQASELDAHGMRELATIDEHFKRVESHSIGSLQTVADEAKKTYDEMTARSSQFSAATIQHFKELALEAQQAADGVSTGWLTAIDSLAGSMQQLAQISGDSFGGIVKDIAQVISAMNMAAKAAQSFNAAQASGSKMGMVTSGIGAASAMLSATGHTDPHGLGHMDAKSTAQNVMGGAMTGAAIGSMFGPGYGTAIGFAVGALVGLARSIHKVGEAEKEARKDAEDWSVALQGTLTQSQLNEAGGESWKMTVIGIRDAYLKAGFSASEAEAATTALWDATKEGPEAVKKVTAAIDSVIAHNKAMIDAIHSMGFQTQEELQATADTARDVYDFMLRAGTYSADQLQVAWERSAHAQAVALGDAAAIASDAAAEAGFKTRAELDSIAKKAQSTYEYMRDSGLYTYGEIEKAQKAANDAQNTALGQASDAVDALAAKYKSLSDSVAKEAPEKVMGVVEKAARAEMAALKSQMDAQNHTMATNAADLATEVENALNKIHPQPIHQKYVLDNAPEGTNATLAGGGVVYAASGTVIPFVPRGTDTVPAMLTPGERVLTTAQNHAYEQGGQQPSNQEVVDAVMSLENAVVQKLPRALARAVESGLVGLRTAS